MAERFMLTPPETPNPGVTNWMLDRISFEGLANASPTNFNNVVVTGSLLSDISTKLGFSYAGEEAYNIFATENTTDHSTGSFEALLLTKLSADGFIGAGFVAGDPEDPT